MGMCSRGRYGFDSRLSNVPHNDFKSFLNQLSKLYKLKSSCFSQKSSYLFASFEESRGLTRFGPCSQVALTYTYLFK